MVERPAMANEPFTIELSGDVSLAVFADEMHDWNTVLILLAEEVSTAAPVSYIIAGLNAGSAVATVLAECEDEEALTEIRHRFEVTGRALQSGTPIPFGSERYRRAALKLISPIGKGVTAIRFETAAEDITITARVTGRRGHHAQPFSRSLKAHGSVTGRIQTLTSRRGLAFTLFESHFDRAVHCYLDQGQEDLIRDKWDRRATVFGLITRDPLNGWPVTIRQIRAIVLEQEPSTADFRTARGVIPYSPEAEPIGDTLRRLRDAWH
jgi:hypothetical protein